MRRTYLTGLVFLTALLGSGASMAEDAPAPAKPACASPEAGLTGAWMAWTKSAVAAGTAHGAKDLDAARLVLNARTHVTLAKNDTVAFLVAPGGAAQPKQYVYAGLASFQVPKDGTYTIATNESMRIDVVQNGTLTTSTKFGHGPNCSTIGKTVEFPLHAGPAALELTGAPYETVDVLIVPMP